MQEYRSLDFAINDDKKNIVEGKAICFNEATILFRDNYGHEYREVILPEALADIDLSQVNLFYNHNHEKAKTLARQKNNTLTLKVREDGVYFVAELKTNLGKDVYQQIVDGELSKCSFGFFVAEDEFDNTTYTRTIKKFEKITDISIVDVPAYDDTHVSARDYFSAKAEAIEKAYEQEQRNRLLIMLG